jgi:uncharacterized protein
MLSTYFMRHQTLLLISCFAFFAGFIDAVVGGGGLVQVPGLLITLPTQAFPTIVGTSKFAGLVGTSISAIQYSRLIKFDFQFLFVISVITAIAAFCGSLTLTKIDPSLLRPFILFVLITIAIYTFLKKDLGQASERKISMQATWFFGIMLAIFVGFYDGFFGPGTGSFFVLGFVVLLGMEFVKASAYAKVVNCVANIASLVLLIPKGFFILPIAILMAFFNGLGGFLGARYALQKGNSYVRKIFLFVVLCMIVRYAYDIGKYYF